MFVTTTVTLIIEKMVKIPTSQTQKQVGFLNKIEPVTLEGVWVLATYYTPKFWHLPL